MNRSPGSGTPVRLLVVMCGVLIGGIAGQQAAGSAVTVRAQEPPASAGPAAGEWRPLFNGTDLTGFTTTGTAVWRVEDGVIVGGQDGDPSRRGNLVTVDEFKDFELELEFLIDEHGTYNSGVQIRGSAYQINIGRHSAGEFIGVGIHRGEPREFVWLSKGDEADTVRKPREWNTLRILAKAPTSRSR